MERTRTRRWPTPIRHDGRDYLTTDQVAKVLGVKVSTVYSYVSRGRLTSHRLDGVDGSVFGVDEVEAALRGPRHRPPAGVVERIRTQVTYLHDDRLYYRGRDVVNLARTTRFEDVAALLWQQPWTPVAADPTLAQRVRTVARPGWRGVDRVRLAVDLLGVDDVYRHRLDAPAVAAKAATVIVGAVAALDSTDSGVSVASRLWPALTDEPSTPQTVDLLNAALVLMADHDLSAGAVAARVAASARGSIYAAFGAGLGAFDGPMHGGATTLARRFLLTALDDPASAVSGQMSAVTPIPGTGHVVYRHRDPRADALLDMMRATAGGDPRVQPAMDTVVEALGPGRLVNSDLALAALALRYRMRPDAAETIFAVARLAGWAAHALEEYDETPLRFRPEGVYTGVRPRPV